MREEAVGIGWQTDDAVSVSDGDDSLSTGLTSDIDGSIMDGHHSPSGLWSAIGIDSVSLYRISIRMSTPAAVSPEVPEMPPDPESPEVPELPETASASAPTPTPSKPVYATQGDVLLQRLIEYFTADDYAAMDLILPIINGEDDVSLRLVDWFVTNYAKKAFTSYVTTSGKRFVVHSEYKLRLRSYRKRRFDPFCRWERIDIPYREGAKVSTTIGQLNFFKWALDNKIIDFIRENRKKIESDMNARNSTARARPSDSGSGTGNVTRKRRQELTTSPVKAMHRESVQVKISFS